MASSKERTYFLLALLLGSTVLAFFVFRPFIATVALAAIFAVLLAPLQARILKAMPKYPSVAALATVLIGCIFVLIPLSLVAALVIEQSRSAFVSLTTGSFSVEHAALAVGQWLEPRIPGSTAYAQTFSVELYSYLQQSLDWLLGRAGAVVATALDFVLQLIVFLMAFYYLLRDGSELERYLIRKSPLADSEGRAVVRQLALTVNSVVKGTLVIAVVQGALAGIGFIIFGVPNALLWGVTTAIAALMPGIGTGLVLVPATLYLVFTGNIWGAVGLALWGMLLVSTIDNILRPYLMSRGGSLHPLIVLLSVLGGLAFYGPAGIFLGPLTASFLYAIYTVYSNQAAT